MAARVMPAALKLPATGVLATKSWSIGAAAAKGPCGGLSAAMPTRFPEQTQLPAGPARHSASQRTRLSNAAKNWNLAWRVSGSELLAPWKRREPRSPHPGPLPKGEGELSAARRQIEASRHLARRPTEHPLLGEILPPESGVPRECPSAELGRCFDLTFRAGGVKNSCRT